MHETVPTLLTNQQVTAFALRFLRGHNICEVKSLYLKSQTSTNRFELDFQTDDEAEEQKVAFLRTALRDLPVCRFREGRTCKSRLGPFPPSCE
jgi:hypothetical protein